VWELIDYKTHYYDNGCDVQDMECYLIRNKSTQESKWVSEYDYSKFKKLGLIA
jgi:hypothetical protein